MSGIFDSEKLDIECPQCKGKFEISVRDLKRPGAKCPKCGVQFESSQFKRELDKIDRQLKDFGKGLSNINIDIKL